MPCLLLIVTLRLTCGEMKIRESIRVSKYYVHDCSCIEYFTEMVGSVLHNKTLHTTFYKDIKGVQPNPLTPSVHKKDIFSTR